MVVELDMGKDTAPDKELELVLDVDSVLVAEQDADEVVELELELELELAPVPESVRSVTFPGIALVNVTTLTTTAPVEFPRCDDAMDATRRFRFPF